MNNIEATQFISNEVNGLWPKWIPTDPQRIVWVQELARCTLNDATNALQRHYKSGKYAVQSPNLPDFLEKLGVIHTDAVIGNKFVETVQTAYNVECVEAPESNANLLGATMGVYTAKTADQSDQDYVMRCGETMRWKLEEIYGGKWILIQKAKIKDNGLKGKQAKAEVYKTILNGEDTPGKRWLLGYIDQELKPNSLGAAFRI